VCHASPYSAPPRMLTVTQMPPSSSHAGTSGRYIGSVVTENPPYPYIIVGLLPLRGTSLRAVRKNGTLVPSLEVANSCVVSWRSAWTSGLAASNGVLRLVSRSYANTVVGNNGELKP